MNHRVNQSLPNAQMENNVLIVFIVIDLTRCIKEKGNKSCEKNTCSVTSCSRNNYLNLKNLTREICFRIKIFNKINPILFFTNESILSFLSQRRRDKNLENRIPKYKIKKEEEEERKRGILFIQQSNQFETRAGG